MVLKPIAYQAFRDQEFKDMGNGVEGKEKKIQKFYGNSIFARSSKTSVNFEAMVLLKILQDSECPKDVCASYSFYDG